MPLHDAVTRTSGESSTCIIRPLDLHACLDRALLLLLRALGGMPVHNGRQPLVDAGVAVVLHMRHIQKCERTCGMQHISHMHGYDTNAKMPYNQGQLEGCPTGQWYEGDEAVRAFIRRSCHYMIPYTLQ